MERAFPLQIKEWLLEAGAGSQVSVLGAASMAGFVAAACSLPFDFVKTRMQEMARNPDGTFPYKGFADCAMQTARTEGLQSFYRGFPTYCIRSAVLSSAALVNTFSFPIIPGY